MMTHFMKYACAAILSATLAGCGGSYEEDLLSQAEEFEALENRVSAMTASGPLVVDNTTGSAKFSGGAAIIAGTSSRATLLIGDADVNVNFDGQTSVSGSITNIGGLANTNLNFPGTGDIDEYSGTIKLSSGSVGSGNQLSVDYAGTLRGNGDTLKVGGTMDGIFKGNPRIRALEMNDIGRGTLNGTRTDVGIEVIAERD